MGLSTISQWVYWNVLHKEQYNDGEKVITVNVFYVYQLNMKIKPNQSYEYRINNTFLAKILFGLKNGVNWL